MSSTRAKFKCISVAEHTEEQGGEQVVTSKTVNFQAVTSDSEENKSFWTATPNGLAELHISNPDAFNQFESGKSYFFDISEAPEV